MIANGRLVFFEQPVDQLRIPAVVPWTACLLRGGEPRGSQVSPIFEPWVPLAFFQKEFDVSEIQSGVRFGYLRPGRAEVLGASERVALLAYAAAARMRTKGASSIRSGYPGK